MTEAPLRLAAAAMGTRFELVLAAGRGDLRAAGDAAIEEIERLHARLSRFDPGSLLSHINRAAWRAPVRLDRDTFELFADALRVCDASGGAFDVTVAPAMAVAGFAVSAVPARNGRIDGAGVRLDRAAWTIALAGPHVSLDLGGIAKGHALDCAARVLQQAGVTSALLHGGTSSVVAIGAPGAAAGWRVALGPAREAPVVELRDVALSVTNAAAQTGGEGNGHVIDPRTGEPVRRAGLFAVTGPSATLADAWSTALAVLGKLPRTFPSGFAAYMDRDTCRGS